MFRFNDYLEFLGGLFYPILPYGVEAWAMSEAAGKK